MPDKILCPDKPLAIKYVIAGFIISALSYIVPIIGFVSVPLMLTGIKSFIHEHNRHFSIAFKSAVKMTIGVIITVCSGFVPETGLFRVSTSSLVRTLGVGIATIYYIYTTHYFTEGVLLDAKTAKMNYAKLGLNTPWILFGVFCAIHFICAGTFIEPIPTITAGIVFMLCLFFCVTLYRAFVTVYAKDIGQK